VIKLAKAGLSDDLVIATINAMPGIYDVSPDGIIALKSVGLSDKVVAAVVLKASAPAGAPGTAAPAELDSEDPMAPHEVGVYLMTGAPGGKRKMVFMERSGEAREKTANVAGAVFSYGIAKVKLLAEIPGPRAAVRATEARPVFYMYFPAISSLGGFGGTDMITSPMQFSLVAFDSKKDYRETLIAKAGIGGENVGVDEKKAVLFTSDRIGSGIYRITPDRDLTPGEYAFIATTKNNLTTATGNSVVLYDFGVDLK